MATFLHSPGVKVYIESSRTKSIIDVTDDLTEGTLTLRENALHTFSFTLLNPSRKYDGVFTPMDRISVKMKRIRWLQVMTGYVDKVPYFSVFPGSASMTASCSLKRLKYWYWDPGTSASVNLLNQGIEAGVTDGGFKERVIRLLTTVPLWPKDKIHIGEIPMDWFEKVRPLYNDVSEAMGLDMPTVGASPTAGKNDPTTGTRTAIASDVEGTGVLPATRGRVGIFGGPNSSLDTFSLSDEPATNPRDPWYLAMRWPYAVLDGNDPRTTVDDQAKAERWWKARRILVWCPKTSKSVVVRPAHWGPRGSNIAAISGYALRDVLGANDGDTIEVRFMSDGTPLGPYTAGTTPTSAGSGASSDEQDKAAALANRNADTTGPTVVGASGLRFTDTDLAEPNAQAAADFIKQNWDVPKGIGGRATSGHTSNSDHYKGLALDVMVSGGAATGAERELGNAIAAWFVANPNAFGTKYVIWYERINDGDGWREYTTYASQPGNDTLQHRDHVHISFNDTRQSAVGPMGGAWPGSSESDFQGGIGVTTPNADTALSLWMVQQAPESESNILGGFRALMNDSPILPHVEGLVQAALRSYCSAPNGDFIAWFPDYFGMYGTAAKMLVRDMEVIDFKIDWDDVNLKTHQYVVGSKLGFGYPTTSADKYTTRGVASIDFPQLMAALFAVEGTDWSNKEAVYARFGARPQTDTNAALTKPEQTFWWAVYKFQQNWAQQFSTNVALTFMPELFPGMLLQVEAFGIQVYVESVTHTFDFAGGGFKTNVTICAPSSMDGSGIFGLPHIGGVKQLARRAAQPQAPDPQGTFRRDPVTGLTTGRNPGL